MTGDKGKRILIHLSSSSSSDDDDVEDGSCSSSASSGEEWESIDSEDEDVDVDEVSESEKADDEESFDNGRRRAQDDDNDDDISLSNRVIQFLQEMKDLHELSLKACKAYLRNHGLRISGNKDVCMKRILEHWRIKDGKAELLYPRSSFVINCTGDVCKGDTVLFTQKVYGSFEKVTRSGKLLGQRTVAGQVVKESYGAAKQQHTFTIEVLWSKGIKKLPSLFPLLVKGRNLYKLKTYRQPWKDEAARRKVLAEKHNRGTAARMKRAKRKEAQSTCKGGRSRKGPHSTKHFPLDHTRRGKCDDIDQMASSSKYSISKFDFQLLDLKHVAGKNVIEPRSSKPFRGEKLLLPKDRASQLQSNHDPSHQYPTPQLGSHPRSIFHSTIPYRHPVILPAVQYHDISRRPFFYDPYGIGSQWINNADSGQFLPAQRRNGVFKCSIRGCNECGSGTCVIAACWRCCRRKGMRCSVHR